MFLGRLIGGMVKRKASGNDKPMRRTYETYIGFAVCKLIGHDLRNGQFGERCVNRGLHSSREFSCWSKSTQIDVLRLTIAFNQQPF